MRTSSETSSAAQALRASRKILPIHWPAFNLRVRGCLIFRACFSGLVGASGLGAMRLTFRAGINPGRRTGSVSERKIPLAHQS